MMGEPEVRLAFLLPHYWGQGGRFSATINIELGLKLVQVGERLHLYDPVQGEFLPMAQEQADRLAVEARRAQDAEAEVARLRAEIEMLNRQR